MMGRSHVLIGMGTMGAMMAVGAFPFGRAALIGVALGSLAPDIDTPYSTVGCRFPFISMPLYRRYGHRTVTHAMPGLMVAALAAAAMEYLAVWSGLAFLIGYVLHIMADLLTKEGCAVLAPMKKKRFFWWPGVKTGSLGETVTVLAILLGLGGATYAVNPLAFNPGHAGAIIAHKVNDTFRPS